MVKTVMMIMMIMIIINSNNSGRTNGGFGCGPPSRGKVGEHKVRMCRIRKYKIRYKVIMCMGREHTAREEAWTKDTARV